MKSLSSDFKLRYEDENEYSEYSIDKVITYLEKHTDKNKITLSDTQVRRYHNWWN